LVTGNRGYVFLKHISAVTAATLEKRPKRPAPCRPEQLPIINQQIPYSLLCGDSFCAVMIAGVIDV
ncbi:hypothetical protein KAR34_06605, partial [bacterium]|nr:hypothetical protein [bacterium]